MNTSGLIWLMETGSPLLLGYRIFLLDQIDWTYIEELAAISPNGLSSYFCDFTMRLTDGPNDKRYPNSFSVYENSIMQLKKSINDMINWCDRLNIPRHQRGAAIYGSMSQKDILYSIVGIRTVEEEYWGSGRLIIDVIRGLRPNWDWTPLVTYSFPVIHGEIRAFKPDTLMGGQCDTVLPVLQSMCKCLAVKGTAKFLPSTEFGFEAAVFTRDFQRRANMNHQFCFYDFYHILASPS